MPSWLVSLSDSTPAFPVTTLRNHSLAVYVFVYAGTQHLTRHARLTPWYVVPWAIVRTIALTIKAQKGELDVRIRNSLRHTRIIMACMLALTLGLSLGAAFSPTAYAADQNGATAPSGRAALRDLQDAFSSIAEDVLPAVVSITSKRTVESAADQSPFEDFFRGFPNMPQPNQPPAPQKRQQVGYGSGVIVRANGYILTNDHVVGGADKVTVKLQDGREFEGKVSRDPKGDLAVVKIEATGLPAAKLGDSGKIKPGMWAIAMGSPFELDQTVTVGVVSAIGRQEVASDGSEARFYPNLIQTDASINPGNSGGPLLNIDGEVIGVNTLIRAGGSMMGGGGNIGIGFAIPVNTAKYVLDQLIAHGKVTRGYLGMVPDDLNPKDADRYGVKQGALVRSVEVDSPADKGDVQVEDVVTSFDGKKISSEIELRDIIGMTPPGKQVKVTVVRNKVEKTLNVTVGEAPDALASSDNGGKPSAEKLGFSVATVTPQNIDKYKLDKGTKGVVVAGVTPGSNADSEGLEAGMLITKVNGTPVMTADEFAAATKDVKSGDTLRLVVKTKDRQGLLTFDVE